MRPWQTREPRRLVGDQAVDQEMPERRVGEETDDVPVLRLAAPRRKVERIRDAAPAAPPACRTTRRRRISRGTSEQLEIIAERLVVARHGFIDEERAHRVDRALRMAEAVGVECAHAVTAAVASDDGQRHPPLRHAAASAARSSGLRFSHATSSAGGRPGDDADGEALLGGEHQADQRRRERPIADTSSAKPAKPHPEQHQQRLVDEHPAVVDQQRRGRQKRAAASSIGASPKRRRHSSGTSTSRVPAMAGSSRSVVFVIVFQPVSPAQPADRNRQVRRAAGRGNGSDRNARRPPPCAAR